MGECSENLTKSGFIHFAQIVWHFSRKWHFVLLLRGSAAAEAAAADEEAEEDEEEKAAKDENPARM